MLATLLLHAVPVQHVQFHDVIQIHAGGGAVGGGAGGVGAGGVGAGGIEANERENVDALIGLPFNQLNLA